MTAKTLSFVTFLIFIAAYWQKTKGKAIPLAHLAQDRHEEPSFKSSGNAYLRKLVLRDHPPLVSEPPVKNPPFAPHPPRPPHHDREASCAILEGLSDPCQQATLFGEDVPNALEPSFIFDTITNQIEIRIRQKNTHFTGLHDFVGIPLRTPIYAYGMGDTDDGYSWPGRTIQVKKGETLRIMWRNDLAPGPYIISDLQGRSVVDTSLHWAYSMKGYRNLTISDNGVPIVPHLHGARTRAAFDGNPEFFFGPGDGDFIQGPRFVTRDYAYENVQEPACLWFHDHALGITRLNVHAGLAAFYIIRDDRDTGEVNNPLKLPAFPYEAALAIQDRMFKENGELFYPEFPGDPYYEDFITGEEADLPPDVFPDGGATALAEFFGDHMIVNGKVWPKMNVEPRHYRLRLLNGCDSRFLVIQFFVVDLGIEKLPSYGEPITFDVIGGDQGFASSISTVDMLLMETGSRYDLIIDFSKPELQNKRIIMKNIGGDEPFGGDIPGPQLFLYTDRIMAFDIVLPFDCNVPDVFPTDTEISFSHSVQSPPSGKAARRVGLFEGKDEYGRLMPLLGTVDQSPINWPDTDAYREVGLTGPIEGTVGWHSPTTETPKVGESEDWEIWNFSEDAHPVHLHHVNFEIIGRYEIKWDSKTNEERRVIEEEDSAAGDGVHLRHQIVLQHNGGKGNGFKVVNPTRSNDKLPQSDGYVDNMPKDVAAALPGQVTVIRANFGTVGRFVWHCHILAHEDHEMMRVMQIVH